MLSPEHKKFLYIEQCLVPGVFNFLINGAIAWALFRSVSSLGLWGEHGFGGDLLITAALLPALTCLIVTPIINKQIRSGKTATLASVLHEDGGLSLQPVWLRALVLALVGVVIGALPFVALLMMIEASSGSISIGATDYAIFKAVWAALLAMLVTPYVGWWALQAASQSED